jgi:hypothetical protein
MSSDPNSEEASMARLELTDDEALMLRGLLEARRDEVLREVHHTDHREFRELLKAKAAMLERMVEQLAPVAVPVK